LGYHNPKGGKGRRKAKVAASLIERGEKRNGKGVWTSSTFYS